MSVFIKVSDFFSTFFLIDEKLDITNNNLVSVSKNGKNAGKQF